MLEVKSKIGDCVDGDQKLVIHIVAVLPHGYMYMRGTHGQWTGFLRIRTLLLMFHTESTRSKQPATKQVVVLLDGVLLPGGRQMRAGMIVQHGWGFMQVITGRACGRSRQDGWKVPIELKR